MTNNTQRADVRELEEIYKIEKNVRALIGKQSELNEDNYRDMESIYQTFSQIIEGVGEISYRERRRGYGWLYGLFSAVLMGVGGGFYSAMACSSSITTDIYELHEIKNIKKSIEKLAKNHEEVSDEAFRQLKHIHKMIADLLEKSEVHKEARIRKEEEKYGKH